MSPTIEETIDRVEKLYATITGRPPPQFGEVNAAMPPEIDPVRHVEDQLARLMSELEQVPAVGVQRVANWVPAVAVWRDEAGFELVIDVPGVPRDQLELRVDDRVLVVRGNRVAPWTDRESVVACEAPFGRFTRAFALPERVEPSQVTARLDAGTLRVRVVRGVQVEPPQVPISCS